MSLSRVLSLFTTLVLAAGLAVAGSAPASAAATVERLAGPDRYDASAAMSRETFGAGVATAYVASGRNFSDALAGVPAAATARSPILLVTGSGVPASVAQELGRLRPGRIVVLGGAGSVSDAVLAQLRSFTSGPVERLWGADRYDTSVAISRATFDPGREVVYVASGEVFSDALAGGAAAGRAGAPTLLVRATAVPPAVHEELGRLAPRRIVVLGGPGTVDDATARSLGQHAPVTRIAGADRYAVSTAVSKAMFPNGAATVYLANGQDYPDALSGGPVAVRGGGPVLLARPTAVPTAVRAEIDRLAPERIVLLGGPGSVVDPTAPIPPTGGTSGDLAAYDAQVLALINAERARHGLAALKPFEPLRRTSVANSAEMGRTGFAHDSIDEIQSEISAAGCGNGWRENIHYTDPGWNQTLTDPSNPVRSWMASKKGHREAILHSGMRYAGMGSATHDGEIYNTLRLAGSCS